MKYCVRARRGGKTTELARIVLNNTLDGLSTYFVAATQQEVFRVNHMLAPWGIKGKVLNIKNTKYNLVGLNPVAVVFDNYDIMPQNIADDEIIQLEERGVDVIVSVTGDGTI